MGNEQHNMGTKVNESVVTVKTAIFVAIITGVISLAVSELIDIKSLKAIQVKHGNEIAMIHTLILKHKDDLDENSKDLGEFKSIVNQYKDCVRAVCLRPDPAHDDNTR